MKNLTRNVLILTCFTIALPYSRLMAQEEMVGETPTKTGKQAHTHIDNRPLTEDQKILHVLNRLGFGPRPGDVARVKKIGLKEYIREQLNPDTIPDEAVEAKVAAFDTLHMSASEIADMERAVQMSNQNLLKLQSDLAKRGAMAGSDAIQMAINTAQTGAPVKPAQQLQRAIDIYANATPEERRMLDEGREARLHANLAGTQLVSNKIVRACESNRQLFEVMVDFWSNHFNIDASKVRGAKVVDEQMVIRPHVLGKFSEILADSATSAAMMLYLDNAQSTAAQNLDTNRRPLLDITLPQLQLAVMRTQAQAIQLYSRVRQLAKTQSITEEDALKKIQQQQRQVAVQRRGLNENYARELMELHTLGVEGGYTQHDVTEVARCLTGWGVKGGRYASEFEFHPNQHDKGEKVVLGTTIPAGGGIEDGKTVLALLANNPSTVRFISTKLCRRFVSDNPPPSLVDRCTATWKRTDGDIREVLNTIFTSREFFGRAAYQAKIKSPFEYVVSAVRATGGSVIAQPVQPAPAFAGPAVKPTPITINIYSPNGSGQTNQRLLSGQISLLGEPLYDYGFPTGYTEMSTQWVSTGALISRINFALNLVNGKMIDVDLTQSVITPSVMADNRPGNLVKSMATELLGTGVSDQTRSTIESQISSTATVRPSANDVRRVASLLLGSPEFQRR